MSKSGSRKGSRKGSGPIFVDGLWDKENAELPEGYCVENLRSNIQEALKKHNPRFELHKLTAYGPNLRQVSQYGIDFVCIPRENLECQANFKDTECLNLVVQNHWQNAVRTMRCTDISDKYMILDMCMLLAEDEDRPLLIIAGDGDYLRFIEGFPRSYLMVAEPEPSNPDLHVRVKAAWRWVAEANQDQMILGGRPRYGTVAKSASSRKN